jgi:glucosamine 6-phosphate synthetase-like amidotransferase/phosphosugar isomerase protein
MCGIAGYSRGADSAIDPHEAGRVLRASVAERGADAAGAAWVDASGAIQVVKQPGGASAFLEHFDLPADLDQVLLHVRDHTKGRPSLPANNHPIRHAAIVGVHNGKIANDEPIFESLGCGRAEPGMTVDSEAIFALLNWVEEGPARALERLRGSLAIGWFDDRRPGSVFLARGYGRPLWTATTPSGTDLIRASTLEALEIVEDFLGLALHKRPVRPGTIIEIAGGKIVSQVRFRPDASASWLLNPVASPEERVACLARLEPRIA